MTERPPAVARNVRHIVRGTLRGFVDLELASGFVLLGCAFTRNARTAGFNCRAAASKPATGP